MAPPFDVVGFLVTLVDVLAKDEVDLVPAVVAFGLVWAGAGVVVAGFLATSAFYLLEREREIYEHE